MDFVHQLIQQLINGVSLGSIYALIALGYTMIYGIIKLINFADFARAINLDGVDGGARYASRKDCL